MNSIITTTGTKKNKIIWAVDPTQNPADAKPLIKEMKTWAKHLNCSIQPVSIFSNLNFNFMFEQKPPVPVRLEEITQKLLDQYIKKTNIEEVLPPEKIFIPSNSKRKMAMELARYAERKKALLLFANTRARKTWNPFRLGGFAETLITVSRTPTLLLNPEAKPSTKIPSILYPTDFSQDSKNSLMDLSRWAKAFNSKILLYNRVETPDVVYMSELSSYWPMQSASFDVIMSDIEKLRQMKAQQWSNFLKKQGVDTKGLIQHQKKTLSADILETAKKNKVSLIALMSRSGPVAQRILGSVAKDILLQAQCPVLIFHCTKLARKYLSETKQTKRKLINNKTNFKKTETMGVHHG